MRKQAWLHSPAYDTSFILAPAFLSVLFVAIALSLWPELGEHNLSPFAWLLLVLAVDVSHVYASIYRTILNKRMWREQKPLLILVPIAAYCLGFLAYAEDEMLFWRILAYLAVFHFVRQPYGLMMIYKREQPKDSQLSHRIDQIAIYAASVYPIILWHLDPSRQFSWFMPGDFAIVEGIAYRWIVHLVAASIVFAYFVKEIWSWQRTKFFNIPKNFILLGTAVSFGMGIVYWNNDFAFTVTNVVGHGVAYMGLVWLTDARRILKTKTKQDHEGRIEDRFSTKAVPILIFLASLMILAYLEEGLWDTLVWKENGQFFQGFSLWFSEAESKKLAWIVPLLALPQATHYIWDGFIWRKKSSVL